MMYQRIFAWRTGSLLKTYHKYKSCRLFSNAYIYNTTNQSIQPIRRTRLAFFVPRRNLFYWFKKPTKNQLRIKDDVPDQYNLIYRSRMDKYILYSQIITTATAAIIFIVSIATSDFLNGNLNVTTQKLPHRQTIENEIFIYLSVFVAIVAVLQVMVSRIPIRIYNLPAQKKYIFVFYGNYPFTQRKLVCTVGDVVPLPETGILPWKISRYFMKEQQQIILIEEYFRRSADLYIMLGVQKDPDADDVNENQ